MIHLKLKNISFGSKGAFIQTTSAGCFSLLVSRNNTKYSLYDTNTSKELKPIFPVQSFLNKSYYSNPLVDDYYTSADFIDVINPTQNITSIIQNGSEVVYCLIEENTSGILFKNDETNVYEYDQKTFVKYPDNMTNSLSSYNSLSADYCVISGVAYNYYQDIPLELNYFDYDNGENFGQATKLKNYLNYNFNVDFSTSGNTFMIDNTRSYKKIGSNQDSIWFSYQCSTTLSGIFDNSTSGHVLLRKLNDNPTVMNSYQFVDNIKQLNRVRNAGLHKSNIFSLEIKDSGLNDAFTNLYGIDYTNKLQGLINSTVRKIINNVAPIHTQLWKINWKGD